MMTITAATLSDVSAIDALARSLAITPERIARGLPFLVSNFPASHYERAIDASWPFLVARHDGNLAGFVLAYRGDQLAPVDRFNRDLVAAHLSAWPAPAILIVKQIAVSDTHQRKGTARALYRALAAEFDHLPCWATVIVRAPPNRASEAFHARAGFAEAARLDHPDGRRRGLWIARVRSLY